MQRQNDFDLVQRIKDGDYNAEKELFARFDKRISKQIFRCLGQSNECWKDMVNEVHLGILTSLRAGKFNPQKGTTLGSYIYGITMNKVKEFFRSEKRGLPTRKMVSADALTEDFAGDFELENQDLKNFLRDVMIDLKLKYQEVLYLRYYDELSIAQIASQLQLPPKRVSERIHYALMILKKKCEKQKYFSIFLTFFLIYI